MYLYDPGILPGSAYQCILGNVCLRSNLSSKCPLQVLSDVSHDTPEWRCTGLCDGILRQAVLLGPFQC